MVSASVFAAPGVLLLDFSGIGEITPLTDGLEKSDLETQST